MSSTKLYQSEHFYGSGESFLFTFWPSFKAYKWTGENAFFTRGTNESISLNNRVFVGKSISTCQDNKTNLEIIGIVSKDHRTGEWILSVTHASSVHEIKSDFLVLYIEDPDSFCWKEAKS
jgi:hypothetical protein